MVEQPFSNEGATQAKLPLLRRFNPVFGTIVAAAPLLGLLGTVLGLIRSFASLELGSVGQKETARVTGGIRKQLTKALVEHCLDAEIEVHFEAQRDQPNPDKPANRLGAQSEDP